MNIIKTKVNFEKRTCLVSGINLTSGDYNSTKMEFTFDREDGIKVLEMKNPSDELVYLGQITNNEVVLVGKADITTKHENVVYIKYLDGSDNVYWYDKENNKLYNTSWQEIVSFNLEDYTKQTKDCSLFTEEGNYVFEISLYDGDSKLTSAFNKLKVLPQQVSVDDEVAEVYLPIFDEMLSDLSGAINEVDNLNISMTKSGTTATITITKKDGTQETKNIYDGEKGDTGPYYTPSVDDSGNISWTNNGGLVNPTTKNIKGPKGDKPVKGVDYFTAQDISDMEDYIINGTTSSFNQNAQAKTEAFNQNASSKTTAFNENATSKTTDFNSNATSKTTSFNENATNKTSAYNSNASDKLSAYNNNHTDKLGAYNDNASEKLSAYNSNAEDKIEEFDAHSEEIDNKVEYYKKYSNALLKTTGTGTSLTLDDTAEAPMPIKLAPSELEQSATPTPNNPQQIHTISGNNTIVLCGKNLFDKTKVTSGKYINSNGEEASYYAYSLSDYMPVLPNTNYTFQGITGYSEYGAYYDKNKTLISAFTESLLAENQHITAPNNCYYVRFTLINTNDNINKFQLEKGSTASSYIEHQSQTYPITLGNLEYCRIGDYSDIFMKPSGKNLFDKASATIGYYLTSTGNQTSDDTRIISDYIYVYGKQAITSFMGDWAGICTCYYDKNKTFISSETGSTIVANSKKFTIPNNAYYMRVSNAKTRLDDLQIEYGTVVTEFEPFNDGKWYLKENIGKVVLDGTEDSWVENAQTAGLFQVTLSNVYANNSTINAMSNLLKGNTGTNIVQANWYIDNSIATFNSNRLFFRINDYANNLAGLKTLLGTTNLIAYYVLATPTFIEITDTTLISQLNALEHAISYQNQTNISQTNNDKPFIISASAFADMNIIISNITNAIIELGGE